MTGDGRVLLFRDRNCCWWSRRAFLVAKERESKLSRGLFLFGEVVVVARIVPARGLVEVFTEDSEFASVRLVQKSLRKKVAY